VLWQHVFQFPQTETHLQKCNFSQAHCKLPEDGPNGSKHVGANIRYFNVNFNILYVQ